MYDEKQFKTYEELEQAIDQLVEIGAVSKDGTIVDYVKVYK